MEQPPQRFKVVGVSYVSICVADHEAAVAFYEKVLGPVQYSEDDGTRGWRLGRTWFTVFPGEMDSPANVEFAIECETASEAERMRQAFIEAGATGEEPRTTWMYEKMRYCPVTDPFGTKLLIYAPQKG